MWTERLWLRYFTTEIQLQHLQISYKTRVCGLQLSGIEIIKLYVPTVDWFQFEHSCTLSYYILRMENPFIRKRVQFFFPFLSAVYGRNIKVYETIISPDILYNLSH